MGRCLLANSSNTSLIKIESNSEMEKQKAVTVLNMKIAILQSYLDMYNPTKYTPPVLAAQKAE